MKDRIPGAPGRYSGVLPNEELYKMQRGESFAITLTRDDQPLVEGTPYSKAAVLPDEVAAALCPGVEDPTPADAFRALAGRTKAKAGFIYPLASAIVPDGFLLCDGAEYSRAEYAELFAAIGTTFGAGDGSTTFNVPDLQERFPMGKGAGARYPVGTQGGAAMHELTVDEMPSHSHELRAQTNRDAGDDATYLALGDGASWSDLYIKTTTSTGSGKPHNNLPPFTVVNYIIATGKGDDVGYVVAGTASDGDVSVIDDNIVSLAKTWSSQKIADELAKVSGGAIPTYTGEVEVE